METFRRFHQVILSLLALFAVSLLFGPTWARAVTTDEPPCEFEGAPGIGGCREGKHWYPSPKEKTSVCEGIDCYYDLEVCCDE